MPSAILNTGRSKIAFSQGNGLVLNATTFVFADIPGLDGSAPVNLAQGMPAPEHIVATLPKTAHGYVADNKVVYSIILGPTVGNFYFNWVGLVDADGVLLGVTTLLTRQYKFATSGLTVGNTLTRNFMTQYNNAAAVTEITVPAEVWQISFMDVLDNIDAALITDMRDFFGRSIFFNDGFRIVSGVAGNYFSQAGIGYVEGLRINKIAEQSIGNAVGVDVYVDVYQSGTFSGGVNTADLLVSPAASPLTDYVDGASKYHFLIKIASISGAGVVTDLRTKRNVSGALIDTFATDVQGDKADSALQPDQLQNHPYIRKLRRLIYLAL